MSITAFQFNDNNIMVKRQWCKGCGICTVLCSNNVFVLDSLGKATIVNPAACTGCGKCEDHCPDLAIWVDRPAIREKFASMRRQSAK